MSKKYYECSRKKYTDSTQFETVYSLDFVPKTRLQTVLGSDLNRSSQKMGDIQAFGKIP